MPEKKENSQYQMPENGFSSPKKWILPQEVKFKDSAGQVRKTGLTCVLREIHSGAGQRIGQILETEVIANSGDASAVLEFRFRRKGFDHVITNGAQSWSSSVAAGKMNDKLVGIRSYGRSLGGKTVPFYEPGEGGEKISPTEGRSYGWINFRDMKAGENLALGVIPGLDAVESIRYRQEGDNVIVSVVKNLEGVSSQRPVVFKVFLAEGGAKRLKYADLILAFSRELAKLGKVPLMKDRVIGFSWPVYGKEVTQNDVEAEVAAGQGIYDTYIIDDGWETTSGTLTIDTNKFPDLTGLAKRMKDLGIKPGIWVSPFKIKGKEAEKLPTDWFIKAPKGERGKIKLPGAAGVFERSFVLDISKQEVRTYLIDKLTTLADIGFEVFKADFLNVPFAGRLQNKDKSAVSYYREFFEQWREKVQEKTGKEIEIIGCGAPMMESAGLFNGIRHTPDSTVPLETFLPFPEMFRYLTRTSLIGGRTNTDLYTDAVAVGARRSLLFREIYGLIWDGIHIADKGIPLNVEKRDRLNKSILSLSKLGISNIFVGDSMLRIGEQGRQIWRDYIRQFHARMSS